MKSQFLHSVWCDISVRLQGKFQSDHSWGVLAWGPDQSLSNYNYSYPGLNTITIGLPPYCVALASLMSTDTPLLPVPLCSRRIAPVAQTRDISILIVCCSLSVSFHVMLLRRRSAQDFNGNPMKVCIFWKLGRRRIMLTWSEELNIPVIWGLFPKNCRFF